MRAKLLIILASALFVAGAHAQTPPNQPMGNPGQQNQPGQPMPGQPGKPGQPMGPQGGQPGKPGQPMPGPQGQPMPGQQMGGQPGQPMPGPQGQPMPGQPGQPGQQMPGQMGGPKMPPEQCEKEAKRLEKMAMNCAKSPKEEARAACFKNAQTKFPPAFWESCNAQTDAVKAKVEAFVAQKHPGQKTGIPNEGPNNNGGQPGQPGMQGGQQDMMNKPPVDMSKAKECPKMLAKVQTEATKCLGKSKAPDRKACFDKVGEQVQANNLEQLCGDALMKIKTEMQSKETSKYPNDPPSI